MRFDLYYVQMANHVLVFFITLFNTSKTKRLFE